jgi:hypothetical protein
MAHHTQKSLEAGPEQVVYAVFLEKGMLFGLGILLVTYLIYLTGIIKPYIPVAEIPNYWGMSVSQYLQKANVHPGWNWVYLLGYGDFLNFIGIALLAGITIICFLVIIPTLWKNNDRVYALLSLLEVIILSVAASGILGSAGH